MATDIDKLVVQLSADIKQYQREMNKAVAVTNRQAKAVEDRFRKMNGKLSDVGRSAARSLVTPLLGVSAALSVREVARYADAWTSAKNSLAVAGVVGKEQVSVLDQLYQSAQNNAAPVGALAGLFGKAAQASDVLGASQADLIKFSDGVAVALRVQGGSAAQASGALTQLGQLLGSARVQAEEFNSVNEGARPILMAVASGLDAAGGSVSKLKTLVNDGKVSGQQFFQAFLKGLPVIQGMAANATTTIEQGITKVENAFTRYIGQTDESLGATQRLVQGLSALADDFDNIADITVKVAALIGAGLLGRSIGGMVSGLGLAAAAATRFVAAIRAASAVSGVATAIGGLSAAAGPIGAVVGVAAVGAMMLYSASTADAREAAEAFRGRLEAIKASAPQMAAAVEDGARRADAAMSSIGSPELPALELESGEAEANLAAIRANLAEAMVQLEHLNSIGVITDEQRDQLTDFNDKVLDGTASAEDMAKTLKDLGEINAVGEGLINSIGKLWSALNLTSIAAQNVKADIQAALGAFSPQLGRFSNPYAKDEAEAVRAAGRDYIAEQKRLQGLTRDQLALETEIAKLRKNIPDGAYIDEATLTETARGNLAANARRSTSGGSGRGAGKGQAKTDYADQVIAVREAIEAYDAESEALNAAALSMAGYGDVAAYAQKRMELLVAAQKQGREITPALTAEIDQLAQAYVTAANGADQARERHERFESALADARSSLESIFTGLITGAHSFTDALGMVISKLAEMAASRAFDGIWDSFLGGVTSNALKGAGYASGGYTGPGARTQPAGIVHKGEVVWSQDDIRKAGGVGVVEGMRRGAKGYASGGVVGSLPHIPSASGIGAMRSSAPERAPSSVPLVVDVRGATGNEEIRRMVASGVQTAISAYDGQLKPKIQSTINNSRRGWPKS